MTENDERWGGSACLWDGYVVPLRFALIVPTPYFSAHYVPCPSAPSSANVEARTEETTGKERKKDKPLAIRQQGSPARWGILFS